MTIPNINNDEEIKAQIAKLQLQLEENERVRIRNAANVKFSNGKIFDDEFSFTIFPIREDVITMLKDLGLKGVDANWKSKPDYFHNTVLEKIATLPNISILFSEDLIEKLKSWQATPHIYCDYNKEHTHVVFNLRQITNTSILYNLSAVAFSGTYNKFVLNIANLIALQEVMETYAKRYPDYIFALSAELETDLKDEIDHAERIKKIVDGDGSDLPPIVLNGITLRNFQAQSIELLKYKNGSAIIALDMGLGKTPVALGYMDWYWKNVDAKQKFLIIGPASLRSNWANEIRKYLDLPVYQISGTVPQSLDVSHLIMKDEYKIFYMNYDILGRGLKTIDPVNGIEKTVFPWPSILSMAKLKLVMDEAHYIKTPTAARTQAINEIDFLSSCLLTGTPMKNGPGELYTLVRQIKPEFAGTHNSWLNNYTLDNGKKARDPLLLRQILAPIMFRRRKLDVIKDLPPINRITIEYELSDKAKALYNQVLQGLYDDLAKWDGSINNSSLIQNMLVQIMRMKQVCSADKVEFVADRAVETYDSDEGDHRKVIIFSQFSNEPPIVERIHNRLGNESIMFTGNDDVNERQRTIDKFQSDNSIHFLCCSTKAASEGLNITAAGHVIFTDLMWTPSDHAQAEGRAYGRISDSHSITSTYVVADGTIEDRIVAILHRKMGQINSVVDGIDSSNESIMKELFGELKNMRMV